MKRRNFLQSTLAVLTVTSFPMPAFSQSFSLKKAFKVKALETRYKEKIMIANAPKDFKLLARTPKINFRYLSVAITKKFGPPLHLHHSNDSFFAY